MLVPVLVLFLALAQPIALQRGLELFRQGKFEEALQQLRDARRMYPTDASIENFIGITETKLGRLQEANADYETAARLDPSLRGPDKNLGFNYLGTGQYDLAEQRLKAALALDPSDPIVHYYLAILYLSTSRSEEAMPHIEPARSLLEGDPATGVLAISACLEAKNFVEAEKLLQPFERESALSVAQEYAIATRLTELQQYVGAVARFQKIVDLQPERWENKYNLAIALVRAKQPDKALALLKPLAAEHAKDADTLAMLASASKAAGNSAMAIELYRKAIADDPTNPDRYLDCTRVLMDLNRYDEAADLLQQGLPQVRDGYALTVRLGAVEVMRGNREAARKRFNEAIVAHPDIALGYVALAQTYMKEGSNEKALEILTVGRGKVPRDFALEYVFGLVSSQLGHQEQAMEALKNAVEMGPLVVEPHYELGILYVQLKQWNDAKEQFEAVLRLDPQHAATYYQLSRIYQRTGDSEKAQQMAKQASLLNRTQRDESIKAEQIDLGGPVP